jgi:hypothetical protein
MQLKRKAKHSNAMVEQMHGGYTGKPIIAGNFFAVAMGMDATMKGVGRSNMDEIALYEVKDGRIVKEQFFFLKTRRTCGKKKFTKKRPEKNFRPFDIIRFD